MTKKNSPSIGKRPIDTKKELTFIKVPVWIMHVPDLSMNAKMVYGRLKTYSQMTGGDCKPYYKTIARDVEKSVKVVQRAISELVKAQLISVTRKGPAAPAVITFLDFSEYLALDRRWDKSVLSDDPRWDENVHRDGTEMSTIVFSQNVEPQELTAENGGLIDSLIDKEKALTPPPSGSGVTHSLVTDCHYHAPTPSESPTQKNDGKGAVPPTKPANVNRRDVKLIEWYRAQYKLKKGKEYVVTDWARECKIAQKLLASVPDGQDLAQRLTRYLDDTDPWVMGKGCSLQIFQGLVNGYNDAAWRGRKGAPVVAKSFPVSYPDENWREHDPLMKKNGEKDHG